MAFASDSTTAPARPLLPLDRRAIGRDGWARAREIASRLGGEIRDHVAEGMRQAWAAARGLLQADRPALSGSVDQIGNSDVVPSYPATSGAVPPLLLLPAPLPSLTSAFSRRSAIFGAVVTAGTLTGSATLAQGVPRSGQTPDARLTTMAAELCATLDGAAYAFDPVADEDDQDLRLGRANALQLDIAALPATELAGVLAKAKAYLDSNSYDTVNLAELADSLAEDVERVCGGLV